MGFCFGGTPIATFHNGKYYIVVIEAGGGSFKNLVAGLLKAGGDGKSEKGDNRFQPG